MMMILAGACLWLALNIVFLAIVRINPIED